MKATSKKSNLPAIAFALAALASTVPSAAFAQDEPRTERVIYSDLNLASDSGIKVLDRRLDRAVRIVCGDMDPRIMFVPPAVARCQRTVRSSITPMREHAIARATGKEDATHAWAENAHNGQPVVTLAE
ncbi:MAG: UrcA family protein [Croceibacterium sp.]